MIGFMVAVQKPAEQVLAAPAPAPKPAQSVSALQACCVTTCVQTPAWHVPDPNVFTQSCAVAHGAAT
jgi:hypothetical protein